MIPLIVAAFVIFIIFPICVVAGMKACEQHGRLQRDALNHQRMQNWIPPLPSTPAPHTHYWDTGKSYVLRSSNNKRLAVCCIFPGCKHWLELQGK